MLAATPITATEAAWVRLKGADAMREAWRTDGVDVLDPGRAAPPSRAQAGELEPVVAAEREEQHPHIVDHHHQHRGIAVVRCSSGMWSKFMP